ncbi:hypothetical protein [Shinella sp. NM-101]|uniref:hypothetical protein n=1 Tax=Shinella sp. NM-101 TaxID=2744455 RepID=UPI001F338F30|nr:hypothetical protein [Shinella sp. NM-101]
MMKEVMNGLWGLFVLSCLAVFMGWMDIPKPIIALIDKINGDDESVFADVVKYAPGNQLRFLRVVNDAMKAYHDAPNEMAKGSLRPKRKLAICDLNTKSTDGDWTGLIEKLSTNNDGEGVLAIKIAPHIVVKTWNNSLSDIGRDTLLQPDSPVYAAAITLREGDMVKFTGTFFPDDIDCIDEASLTIDGSMTAPEFIIKFASLSKF